MKGPLMSGESSKSITSTIDCHGCSDGAPVFTPKSTNQNSEENTKYKSVRRKLVIAACFVTVFMAVECIGGYVANSLAILTDAAHMFSDLAAFLISIGALFLTTRDSSPKLSFGWHRVEILGVLISILLIWGLTGALIFEAVRRIAQPEPVNGPIIFGVATAGLIFNLIIMRVLKGSGHGHSHGGDEHDYENIEDFDSEGNRRRSLSTNSDMNINVRAAWIHALGDIIQSVGVMVAGIVIWIRPDYEIADPICTFVFSILVLFTTFRMLIDAVNILMAGTPQGIDFHEVRDAILSSIGVLAVHDLHVWCLTVGKPLLSVHVIIDYENPDETLEEIRTKLRNKFKISHSTVQMERQAEVKKGIFEQRSVLLSAPIDVDYTQENQEQNSAIKPLSVHGTPISEVSLKVKYDI